MSAPNSTQINTVTELMSQIQSLEIQLNESKAKLVAMNETITQIHSLEAQLNELKTNLVAMNETVSLQSSSITFENIKHQISQLLDSAMVAFENNISDRVEKKV